jgi:hypothetical protein
MKTILKLVLFLGLVMDIGAQNSEPFSFEFLNNFEGKKSIKFDQSISIFNSLCLLIAPQFDDLFTKSFNEVESIEKLKNFYDDYDLGFNLGFSYHLKKGLKLVAIHSLGIIKFNNSNLGQAQGYYLKLSLNYIF